jgi:RalA-binding protein 1
MLPPTRPGRQEARPTPQRNPSIDSAASSLSSSASQTYRPNLSHAPRPSQDTNMGNPPDLAALITAAGSPEAALLALWKKEQSASHHNGQLWRLVEKQRSMIIGLQKDLERSLKDKDRYRKKLKDYTNQVPPLPGAPQRSDTFGSVVGRDESPSPVPSEKLEDLAKANPATKPVEHKASPLTQETSANHPVPESQLAHSPSHSDVHTASNPTSSVNSPNDFSVKPLAITGKGPGLNALIDENHSVEQAKEQPRAQTPPKNVTPPPSSEGQLSAPALHLTQATPVLGGDGFDAPTAKPAHPLRKAPPAPLNLVSRGKPSAHLHQATPGEQHDSDNYDDTLEVDEIPIVERGRRKTREDDDRIREAIALKEEARSKSKKHKSGSKSNPQSETASPSEEQAQPQTAPLSPRHFSPPQTGLPLSPRHPPANSLNALLSPTASESSTLAQRSVGSPPLMSPGLPTSPRPGDRPMGSPLPRNPKQSLASPPMSPRSGANGVSQPPLRTQQQPVPLPPGTPQSYTSPQVPRPEPPVAVKQPSTSLLKPPAQPSPETDTSTTSGELPNSEHVYRGLVSDQYPGLLLPPNALPSIEVKVSSSRLRPSRLSFLAPKPQEEDPVFHLAVYARSDGKQLWRMEKTIMALPALDAQLKSSSDFSGKLPERALFSGHAPAKIDARRAALNHYFDTILETPLSEKAGLLVCDFFSTDVIGAQNGDALAPEPTAPQVAPAPKGKTRKEGYLTKRGKNFGGWKARYFVLDGPEFRYYEMAGGAHLGTIKLYSAQIGKQSQQQSNQSPQRRDDSEDNQYRHAFLILEPKRKDSTSLVRHVLCAESDEERDAWVEALLQHVDYTEETSPTEAQPPSSNRPAVLTKPQREIQAKDSSRSRRKDSPPDTDKSAPLQGLSYEDTIAAEAPMRGPTHREAKEAHAHSPKTGSFSSESSRNHPSISGPSNGAPIQNLESWGNKTLAAPTPIKDKKRSIFGFSSRQRASEMPSELFGGQSQQVQERNIMQNRNVFGIPLGEAVEYTQPIGLRDPLPSVVFRSLEYLRSKNAINEEGIFRLSGSNIVIRGLRERFNTEGDVKLLDGQYYDIHAVASLLKLYLRELPSSVLTRDLHLDFLKVLGTSSTQFGFLLLIIVLDMDERSKKIQSFNVLVHRLPRVNFELLRHVASFLIEIVENAAVNKMTVRNVGIVFAPTLNIPAPLISFFLTDYPDIFGVPIDEASSPIHELRTTSQQGDEIRSPRRQMFSDIPTPAYNETTFQQPFQQPMQPRHDRPPSSFPVGMPPPSYAPPQPPQQQQQHASQYAGYETGFIPLRPSYEAPAYEQQYQQADGYGSLNGVAKGGTAREQRQRKRESGMLLMNMGMGQPRKGSNGSNPPPPRDYRGTQNPLLIREETAFD